MTDPALTPAPSQPASASSPRVVVRVSGLSLVGTDARRVYELHLSDSDRLGMVDSRVGRVLLSEYVARSLCARLGADLDVEVSRFLAAFGNAAGASS